MKNREHPKQQTCLQVLSGKLFQIRLLTWPDCPAPSIEALWQGIQHPDEVLKDDRRSRVLKTTLSSEGSLPPQMRVGTDLPGTDLPETQGDACVFKRILYKDRRLLNRFLSFFQSAEACRAFEGSIQLIEAGFPVPRPRALLEHRAIGFLVEAWFVYDFVCGEPVEEKDWPQVVSLLTQLHSLGFAHGDTHLANWLSTPTGIVAIDLIPRSLMPLPFSAKRQKARDFLLLRNCQAAILPYLPGVGERAWIVEEKRYRRKLRLRHLRKWFRQLF
jgi:hypothetical protein